MKLEDFEKTGFKINDWIYDTPENLEKFHRAVEKKYKNLVYYTTEERIIGGHFNSTNDKILIFRHTISTHKVEDVYLFSRPRSSVKDETACRIQSASYFLRILNQEPRIVDNSKSLKNTKLDKQLKTIKNGK
jgi:hypothetical protein